MSAARDVHIRKRPDNATAKPVWVGGHLPNYEALQISLQQGLHVTKKDITDTTNFAIAASDRDRSNSRTPNSSRSRDCSASAHRSTQLRSAAIAATKRKHVRPRHFIAHERDHNFFYPERVALGALV